MAFLLLGAVAACVTAPRQSVTSVPALQPFLGAGRFVPKGMTSFSCNRGAFQFPNAAGTSMPANCVVSAGRDFRLPKDLGLGPSRTLWIVDSGGPGADATLRRTLQDANTETDTTAGLRAWHVLPASEYDLDAWCTVADDRFVLVAFERGLLVEALARATDLETELARFGDLSFLPADATDLLFRESLPLQKNRVHHGPLDGLVVGVIRPSPWRIALFSRVPPADSWDSFLEQLCVAAEFAGGPEGGWWRRGGVLKEQAPLADSVMGSLVWMVLFGHLVFI